MLCTPKIGWSAKQRFAKLYKAPLRFVLQKLAGVQSNALPKSLSIIYVMFKRHSHTPIHAFFDDTPYFLTGAIYKKRPLLAQDALKEKLLKLIRENFQVFGWQLNHWVILNNHYHLLGISHKGKDLSKIIQKVHGDSGKLIRAVSQCEKPIWWNYWDYCPRNEREYLIRLNYLLTNPIKHGYVSNLNDYAFSSFHELLVEKGKNVVVQQFQDYSEYKELCADEDDF